MKKPSKNSFVLNKDDYRKSDNHPTHKGVADIDGKLYWISGWYNVSDRYAYFKGDFRPVSEQEMDKYFKEDSIPTPKTPPPPITVRDEYDDELPF